MPGPPAAHGAGAIAEAAVMIIPAVGHVTVDMGAGHGTAFYGTQRKAGPRAIPAFMVVPAIEHAIMHMTASNGTAINRANGYHGLLYLCTLSVMAASSMPTAMGEGGNTQQVHGHDTRQGG